MTYDPAIHHRRSIRMRGHDYASPGLYFVTLCTTGRCPLFGAVVNGRMALNDAGRAAAACWREIPRHFPNAALDEWVVMPDHLHGIIQIVVRSVRAINHSPLHPTLAPPSVGANGHSPLHPTQRPRGTSGTLGSIMRGFKIGVTRLLGGDSPWHRNYWDVIIRDDRALAAIRSYILMNPANYQAVMQCGEPKALGDRSLLDRPKLGFLASRGASALHGNLVLRPGEAILSGFLSPMERRVFAAGLAHKTPLIWVKPWALEDQSQPPAVREAITQGRLLILSPFADSVTAPSARRAVWCNEYVLTHSQRIVVGHLNPDGMLACILSEADPDKELVFL